MTNIKNKEKNKNTKSKKANQLNILILIENILWCSCFEHLLAYFNCGNKDEMLIYIFKLQRKSYLKFPNCK